MSTKLSILIVEDEVLIAESLRYTLEDLGFSVIGTAQTFEQGVRACQTNRPDLVLLDINLSDPDPEATGLNLARRLSQAPAIPFIFLTAYADHATILEATRLRPVGYLIKPVNPALLFATIQTAIGHLLDDSSETDLQSDKLPDFFFVKVGNRNLKLYWKDVYCLEASKNYVLIRIGETMVPYAIRGTLNFVLQQLVPPELQPMFRHVSRSAIVNLSHITSFTAEHVCCHHYRIDNNRLSVKELRALMGDGKR